MQECARRREKWPRTSAPGSRMTIETPTGSNRESASPETKSARVPGEKLTARHAEVRRARRSTNSRILTEVAIYADKIAVDEETGVRLRSHVSQLRDMLLSDEPMGRKMDFSFRRSTARQHHRLEVQRCRHRARCGRAQGGGRKDPRAGAEHRVRGEANEAAEHRIWQHGVRRAPDRRRQP